MGRLAAEAAGEALLDIGIGGGRTTEFLLPFTSDYVGIDYLAEFVTAARRRFPEVRFEQMDAREMSRFSSESFGAVVFSLNGIDGISHADRLRAIAEIRRVLRPGGWFAYSTHNLAYTLSRRREEPMTRRGLAAAIPAARAVRSRTWEWWRRRLLRNHIESGEGWATIPGRAYGHPVIWHHITCATAIREMTTAGLDAHIEIFTSQGEAVVAEQVGGALSVLACPHSADLHVLAQRAETA
jgi:SAM-dependent methyltransferase